MIRPLHPGRRGFMPLHQFKLSAEFNACTPKQQIFILKLIETRGDYTLATLTAYESKGPRQASIFSCVVRRMDHVKAALDLYCGRTQFDILYDEVVAGLKASEPGSVSYQRLLSQKERLLRERAGLPPVTEPDDEGRVPAGCRPVYRKGTRELLGWITPDGQRVQVESVEAAQ